MGGHVAATRVCESVNFHYPRDKTEGEITCLEKCINCQKYLLSRSCGFGGPVPVL
jgi:hypothetical protein